VSRRITSGVCAAAIAGAAAVLGSAPALAASALSPWVLVPQSTDSTPVYRPSLAFDGATGQLLLVDGTITWSWDGAIWVAENTGKESGRYLPAIAYDPATMQMVSFGGAISGVDSSQTWTWNGNSWFQQHPAAAPPARDGACAAYDIATKQLVMFGGTTGTNHAPLADTWNWTGANWVQLHPSSSPSGGDCSMAYDPAVGGVVLATIGSTAADQLIGVPQLWLWGGLSWTALPSSLPSQSDLPSISYDPDIGALVAYAAVGQVDTGVNRFIWDGVEDETWTWDTTTWSMVSVTTPQTRTGFGPVAYDDATGQLVLYGSGTRISAPAAVSLVTPTRFGGVDRLSTAVAVSQTAFQAPGSASAVVLSRWDSFADALAGGPLAAARQGPLLLTPPGALSLETATEIRRVLKPGGTVYLVGGTSALSATVASEVSALGAVVVRLAGPDRFGTALAIAAALGNPSTIFEASGGAFADALSAVPAAIADHGAILLTNGPAETPATAAYLHAHPGLHYAVGGPAASADPAAIALAGANRYATSAAVALAIFPHATGISAASGMAFPDALSGGPIAGLAGQPLLLVPQNGTLSEPAASYLKTRGNTVMSLRIFGGIGAVDDDVAAQMGAALN
jgi:ell wall binding domain 2 (CWB2)